MKELTDEENVKYEEEINRLTEELIKAKRTRVESPPHVLEIQKQESRDSKNESIDFKLVSERQEGEVCCRFIYYSITITSSPVIITILCCQTDRLNNTRFSSFIGQHNVWN